MSFNTVQESGKIEVFIKGCDKGGSKCVRGKMFDPYFTAKYQNKCAGIWLYTQKL